MRTLFSIAILLATAKLALADGNIEVITTNPPGMTCYEVTFEGGGFAEPICPDTNGLVPGTPIRFDENWVTADLSTTGLTTVALWNTGGQTVQIEFDVLVASVRFDSAAIVNASLRAYDSSGQLLDQDSHLNTDGFFPLTESLSVGSDGNEIAYVEVQGNVNQMIIDNLKVCVLSDPVTLIEDLAQYVILLNLHHGIENSLDAKLDSAFDALDDVNENNNVAACNSLSAFIDHVQAQSGNKIDEEDADFLNQQAQAIIDLLEC